MVDSQEPALPENGADDITDIDPDPPNDVEMNDNGPSFDQNEVTFARAASVAALLEANPLDFTGFENSTSGDIEMGENDNPLDEGKSPVIKPEVEADLSEINIQDTAEADSSILNDASPVESARPIDLGMSSLGKSRTEKALLEVNIDENGESAQNGSDETPPVESAHDPAQALVDTSDDLSAFENTNDDAFEALLSSSGDVPPDESFRDADEAPISTSNDFSLDESIQDAPEAPINISDDVPPVESSNDTAEIPFSTSEDAAFPESNPINLGEPALNKPKTALNLGRSTLSKPASEATREKALALQAKLAKQFAQKNAAKVVSDTSGVFSPPHTGENVASVHSSIFPAPDFSESAAASGDVDPKQVEFELLEAAYLLKKRAGTSDIEADVNFLKAEAKEMARQRKAKADEYYERDPTPDSDGGLFVTPAGMSPASHAPAAENFSDDGAPKSLSTTTKKGRKRKSDAPGTMGPPSKKSKKPKASTGRSLANRNGGQGLSSEQVQNTINAMQSGSKPVASKTPATTSRRAPGHNISNVQSLMTGTDVFRDTAVVAGHSNQPGFKAGISRRDLALRDLIASVPQEERAAASGDKKFLMDSLKDFDGQGSCKPSKDGDGWTLSGMKCTLKHYQVLGVAFMRKRENQDSHPRGGILADEMGLGKTIQMIANIINGKPKRGQPRTTLIVASPALISQWYREIVKFAQTRKENRKHGIHRIIQHRAGYRQGGDDSAIRDAIMDSDICLTTYGDINKSYPKVTVPPEITTETGKMRWWTNHFQENKGVFHDMKFLRVVLDEAQAIKNHTSHSSLACRALKSEYYWAISGTPLVNGIAEMYPYLKFLRHPHCGSMRTFQANFCSPNDPTGSEKLGVFLKQIMIRRTHTDLLFGARLLDLPTPKQNVIFLEFNAVERSVYEIVKQRFIQRINTMSRRDGVGTYSNIWTMLLRLRQICCHILLIQVTILDLLQREDFEKLDDITKKVEGRSKDDKEILEQLAYMLREHTASDKAAGVLETSVAGIDVDVVPGGLHNMNTGGVAPDLGKKHGKSYNFQKYLTSAAQTEEMDAINKRTKCCSCRETPEDAQSTLNASCSKPLANSLQSPLAITFTANCA